MIGLASWLRGQDSSVEDVAGCGALGFGCGLRHHWALHLDFWDLAACVWHALTAF